MRVVLGREEVEVVAPWLLLFDQLCIQRFKMPLSVAMLRAVPIVVIASGLYFDDENIVRLSHTNEIVWVEVLILSVGLGRSCRLVRVAELGASRSRCARLDLPRKGRILRAHSTR